MPTNSNSKTTTYLSKEVENMLIQQIAMEHQASMSYLAMAVWAEVRDYEGAAAYLRSQSEEERAHMLRFVKYLTDLGYDSLLPENTPVRQNYDSLHALFEKALNQEKSVTAAIHKIVEKAWTHKDFATFQFLQYFVEEQREEEQKFRHVLAQFDLLGKREDALYWIDKSLKELAEKE